MPSKLEQLQLQFRQRIKEERLIKIHTDNQQKALSQVSKYSHTGATQSVAAPSTKPSHQPAISIPHQPQPHHSPIKKGSPGVDRSRPLPPIANKDQYQSNSSSPVNGSSEYATPRTIQQNSRSKSVDMETKHNPPSRNPVQNGGRMAQNGTRPSLSHQSAVQMDNGGRMPPRNDSYMNGGTMTFSRNNNGQNGRMQPSSCISESVQNGRMAVSRSDSVQNGKTSMRNGLAGAGKTVAGESKPDASFERKHDQELLNKMKQAELQRLRVNTKIREDTSPRNGNTGTISKPSNEARKTAKSPSPAPPPNRSKPRTQAAPPPRRPTNQPSTTKTTPRNAPLKDNNAPSRKPPGPGQEQCSICGRNFNQDRIEKHVTICKKAASKKVKVFDATKMRTKGTEAEQFVRKGLVKSEPKSSKKSDWRKKHNEFIEAIRQAKLVQQHLANGGKVSDLPPPKPSDTSDYVQCPHCNRKFNEGVAERHIPKCKNILSNKKPPPTRKNKGVAERNIPKYKNILSNKKSHSQRRRSKQIYCCWTAKVEPKLHECATEKKDG
ncbi:hypothetical protein JTE90_004525 [Oedothorax gibbosus]|uniref:C2HC/C3H-type domain-containing protein n=1 Tax=Oedothorax gibbosus TaxID=931172 RepID=A0AAV6VCB7_9ARAC|nr:hypothetical protein JTE90_004525 [Oedothorax gibbosus]